MVAFDSTQLSFFLTFLLVVAVASSVYAVALVAQTVSELRRDRLVRGESLRGYYGRLAFHH